MSSSCSTDGVAKGEARKQRAFKFLEANRESYILAARRALLETLLANGTATADDVRAAVKLPPGLSPKCFGVVPGPLAKVNIIKAVGFQKSARPKAHARPISIWKLRDRAKAEAWLAAHPLRE